MTCLPQFRQQREGETYGAKKRESNRTMVIRFHIDDSDATITFTQGESVDVKSVLLDILMEE